MKVLLIVVAFVSMTLRANAATLEQTPREKNQDLITRPIINLTLEAPNINLLLSTFSAQTNTPIGLEVSPYDDLSTTKTIRVEIKQGTLADALNSIVKQNPLYTWKIQNEVVNVFPTDANRDLLLREVLETKLEKFSLPRGAKRFALRQTLSTMPTITMILNEHHVVPQMQSFMSRDFDPLGREYGLEASNVSVSALLNQVIRESNTKYWLMLRDGSRKQYFVLNL